MTEDILGLILFTNIAWCIWAMLHLYTHHKKEELRADEVST